MVAGAVRNSTGGLGMTTLDQTAHRTEWDFVLSGTVLAGDVLVWDGQTTDDHPTVHQADVSANDVALVAGVALEGGVSGEVIIGVRNGPVKVNIGDGTVALGDQATFHATADGCADGANADATTVSGDTFGSFLGAEIGATNQAILDLRR